MTKETSPIRVVVVDDESPARRKIHRFLAEESDFEIVGEAGTGLEAVRVVGQTAPDLVFLDVQMPGLDGFAVLQSIDLEPPPQIVFTTAYDHFAIQAFEVHALDYLLKPFDQARFKSVLQRAREQRQRRDQDGVTERVAKLLEELSGRERRAERLLVTHDDRAFLLTISQIDWIEAAKNYVHIHAGKESYRLRGTLEALHQKLDPAKFLRANRSQIINLDRVKELHPWFHGEYKIVLGDGKEVMWSRRYLDAKSDLILKRI